MRTILLTITLLMLAGPRLVTSGGAPSPRRLVISIPDRRLAVVEDGRIVREYAVAVGKPATPTPTGWFQIRNREQYHESKVASDFGTRWLEFFRKRTGRLLLLYGIHGTNLPQSVGTAASHGCIRLHNGDVEDLFGLTYVGEPVYITVNHLRDLQIGPAG